MGMMNASVTILHTLSWDFHSRGNWIRAVSYELICMMLKEGEPKYYEGRLIQCPFAMGNYTIPDVFKQPSVSAMLLGYWNSPVYDFSNIPFLS